MKKRIFASVMALCMALSLLPISALAEEIGTSPKTEDTCICEIQCTEDTPNMECPVCAEEITGCTAPAQVSDPEETTPLQDGQTPAEGPSTPTGETAPTTTEETGEPAGEPVPYAEGAVYVSAEGDDSNPGTSTEPFATLAKAVDAAEDGDTIYVMSDLTMTKCARYYGKDLTITSGEGGPYTLTRGETFAMISDDARSWYNPAMIEVDSSDGPNTASLTLTNIILDDAGIAAPANEDEHYYIQAASKGEGFTEFGSMDINHGDIVQDAIIATYNGVATITLGDGAVLKNYGGMSAVRLSDGKLIMKDGSAIYDDREGFTRSKGSVITGADKGLYGPAGAIWMQGGEFIMEQGAEISNLNGRVVYADSGEVNISGSIYDITSNSEMWQGTGGYIAHLRSGANGTLGDGCDIYNTFTDKSLASGAMFNLIHKGTLEMESGARIHDWNGVGNCFFASDATLILNGEIGHVNTDGSHILQCVDTEITVGPSANIHHNKVAYGTLYIQGGNTMDVYGKINYNYSADRGGAIAITNHGDSFVTMYDGAEMIGNYSKETGGAILVSDGSFTMYGGTIKGNHASMDGGGVFVRQGGSFYMKGGTISGNYTAEVGGGVAFQSEEGCVEITDGTISDNYMKATLTPDADKGTCTAEGGVSNDFSATKEGSKSSITTNYKFDDGAVMANAQFFMEKYGFTIDRIDGVKLGNAATACETAATTKYGVEGYGYLGTVVGSFWYQSDSNVTLDISGLSYDEDKLLFAAIVPTDQTGAVDTAGESTLIAVTGGESFRLPLEDSANGYAVVFLQETQPSDIITVIPASLTAYMGGNGGYEGVVNDEGGKVDVEDSGSLPRPIFQVKGGPADVALTNLTFENRESHNSWKLVSVGDGYYRFEPTAANMDAVRVQYSDGTNVVTEDEFTPETDVFKEYTVTIYAGETAGEVQVNAADEYYTCTVITGPGVLTVRAVEADDPTSDIVDAITAPVTSGSATAVAPAGTTYTLNDTDVALPTDSKPSLLFDEIITSDDVDRIDALENAVDTKLGATDGIRHYEAKYLDLVDANNGNAWIKASKPVTIYWGYPATTDQNTTFKLLHFEDLHRDTSGGDNTGFDPDDIADSNIKEVEVTNNSNGISFTVEPGGFSPFVLVWETAAEPDPGPGPDPNPGGGGGSHSDPTGNLTISLGGNGGNEDFTFTVIFTDEDGDELENNFYYNGDYTGTIGSGDEITLTGGDKIVIRNLPEGTRYEVIIETADGYTATSTGAEGVIRTSGNEAAFSVTPTVVLADPSITGVTRWLNTTDHTAYLSGYPGGTFGPDNSMTRAEVAQMFYALLLNKDVTITKTFSDVPADAWYATAVNTLASLGMVSGDPDGTFRPNDPITRAEFCVIALAFAYEPDNAVCYFGDVSRSDWFYTYVAQAASYGWIGGYTNGYFGPNDQITRAQVTTIVNNMLGRAADRDYVIDHQADLVQFSDLTRAHWGYFQIMEATNAHNYTKSNGTESWR